MITLTVPKRIRSFFLWDRKLLGLLARCAAETIRSFYRHLLQEPRGRPGIVASIQTVVAQFMNTPAFVEQELITQEVAQNMLAWPHSGFHVHIGSRLHTDDHDALEATLRYAARAPISLQKLHYDRENRTVTYCCTSAYDHREHIERLAPLEMIARLTSHIPGRYERLIRYYGVYSSRSLGTRRAKAHGEERAVAQEKTPPTHLGHQWQRLVQRLFGVTLRCPTCHTEMKIIAVITQDEPIHKILAHLKSRKIDPRAGPLEEQAA